jgi:HNH endonuclease
MHFHNQRMRRLAASGLLPQRAGQPVKAWVHISLAELLAMEGSTALVQAWVSQLRAAWAGHRAAASAGGGEPGAWLDGQAAAAVACDAAMAPYVTGDVNPAALDDLVRLSAQLYQIRHGGGQADGDQATAPALASEALEQAIIGAAVDLLSGPGGLASFLRRQQLGDRLGGPSQPLDIGYSQTIPAGIRNAVILRGKHCEWAGRCNQPASACEVHHVRHKKDGGETSTKDCVLLCFFHHQVVIHRWGWTLVLNPDGTTTAWNPDRTKVLHSHGPPVRPG